MSFKSVGGEEGGAREVSVHVVDFPGEVVGVLDAGIASEAVDWGMAVDRVAQTKTVYNQPAIRKYIAETMGAWLRTYIFPPSE